MPHDSVHWLLIDIFSLITIVNEKRWEMNHDWEKLLISSGKCRLNTEKIGQIRVGVLVLKENYHHGTWDDNKQAQGADLIKLTLSEKAHYWIEKDLFLANMKAAKVDSCDIVFGTTEMDPTHLDVSLSLDLSLKPEDSLLMLSGRPSLLKAAQKAGLKTAPCFQEAQLDRSEFHDGVIVEIKNSEKLIRVYVDVDDTLLDCPRSFKTNMTELHHSVVDLLKEIKEKFSSNPIEFVMLTSRSWSKVENNANHPRSTHAIRARLAQEGIFVQDRCFLGKLSDKKVNGKRVIINELVKFNGIMQYEENSLHKAEGIILIENNRAEVNHARRGRMASDAKARFLILCVHREGDIPPETATVVESWIQAIVSEASILRDDEHNTEKGDISTNNELFSSMSLHH